MATLNINVKGIEALARASQGFGGDALTRQLRTQGRLAERMARTFQSTLDSIDKRLGGIARQMDRQFTSVIPAGMERRFNQTTNNIQVNVTQLTRNVSNQFTNISNTFERGMDKALDKVERRGRIVARRLAAGFALAGRGLGRAGTGLGRGLGGAGGLLGSAIGGFGSGGPGIGGLVRSVGNSASGLLGGAGSLLGGAVSGAGGAIGGGISAVTAPFGPVVGTIGKGIGAATTGITAAVSGALQGAAAVGSGVLSAAANLGGAIADRISGILKVGLIAGVAVAFAGVAKAADFERIEEPFRNIAQSVGVDATEALERFRESTRGTISDLDLMTSFNRAVQLGAVENAEQFEKLTEASRRLGKAVGRDAGEALEDLTLGIGRQSRLILDNLGIIVSAEAAYQRYAEELGTTASALTDVQKRTAFVEAAMSAVDTALAKAGPEVTTFADTWDRLKATFENLLVSIGRPLLAALGDVLPQVDRIAQGFGKWLSDNRVELGNRLRESLSGVVGALRSIAGVVEGNSLGSFLERATLAVGDLGDALSRFVDGSLARLAGEIRAIVADIKADLAPTDKLEAQQRSLADARRTGGKVEQNLAFAEAANLLDRATSRFALPGSQEQRRTPDNFVEVASGKQFIYRDPSTLPTPLARPAAPPAAAPPPSAAEPNSVAAEAMAAEARIRSGLESLEALGITLSELPPEISQQFSRALESEEAVAKLRERAAEHASRSFERALDAEIDFAEQRIRDIEKQKAAQERALRAYEDGIEDLGNVFHETIEGIRRSLEEAQAQIEYRRQQTLQDIERQVQGRVNALAGIGGGLDPRGGVPLNVFKAIEKVRRAREKERFESLRAATSGLSSTDLAANDGFLLQQVLREQAEREVGSAALIAEANARAAEELRVAASEAAAAEEAAGAEFVAAAEDLRFTLGEVSKATINALTETAAALREAKAEQEVLRKTIERFKGLVR